MNTLLPKRLIENCLKRRPTGIWSFRKQIGGRRFDCSLNTTKKDDAIKKAALLFEKYSKECGLTRNGSPFNPDTTLQEATDLYFRSKSPKTLKSEKFFKETQKYVLRHFGGGLPLSKMTLPLAQDYVNDLKTRLSATTVRHRGRFLKGTFSYACKLEIITANPLLHLTLPKVIPNEPHFLERHDVSKFLEALDDYNRLPCFLAIKTGMRKGEILALTWDMVHLGDRKIELSPEICKNNTGRVIPVDEELERALRSHQSKRYSILPFVFLNEQKTGQRTNIRCGVERAFEKIGRSELTFHCLRKTFATLYLEKYPDDLYNLMKIGGWKDISTLNRYVGLTREGQTDRSKRIHEAIPFSLSAMAG